MEFIRYFNLLTILLTGLVWVCFIVFLRFRRKKNFIYLLFFSLFYVYLIKVLDYTLFQFQSLLLLKHFMPNLMLRGQTAGKDMNLFPLVTLTIRDVTTSLLNILLFIPFGLGLPFITNLRMKKVVVLGAAFSVSIEVLQFVTGLLAKITFRIADINDVIFNTAGVVIGFLLFVELVHIFRNVFNKKKLNANQILEYITQRPQVKN